MLSILFDFFFPRRSLNGEEGEWITLEERQQLKFKPIIEDEQFLRMRNINFLDRLVAASSYHHCPLLQKAIRTLKYRHVQALAEELGMLVARANPDIHKGAVLCPVPLHWTRRFQRGFNQAELIARTVAREQRLPIVPMLKRRRQTGFQAHRSRNDRLCAVRDAFAVCSPVPAHIILIDDVATTAATLDACAAALKKRGAKIVEGWVVARG